MTPKSLFNIIIKVFGLLFLKELIITIPALLSSIFYYYNSFNEALLGTVLAYVVMIVLYILLVLQLLFKTNKIVDKLGLAEGFNQEDFSFEQTKEFPITISASMVMKITLLVIGGYILIDEIPNLGTELYLYFKQKSLRDSTIDIDLTAMVTTGLKVLIGVLILGERNTILEFIEKKQKPAIKDTEEKQTEE